jgi:hypothetical protein
VEIVSFRRVFELDRRAYRIDPHDPRTRLPFVDGVPLRGVIYTIAAAVLMIPLSEIPPFSWIVNMCGDFFAPGHSSIGAWAFRIVLLIGFGMWAYRARFDGRPVHRWAWHWLLYAVHAPCTSAGRPYNPDAGTHCLTSSVKFQWDLSRPTLPRGRIRGDATVHFREPVLLPPTLWRPKARKVKPAEKRGRTGPYQVERGERLELRP